MTRIWIFYVFVALVVSGLAFSEAKSGGEDPAAHLEAQISDAEEQEPKQSPLTGNGENKSEFTDAEKYAVLWLRLVEAKKTLAEVKNKLEDPKEFQKSLEKFLPLQKARMELKKEIEQYNKAGNEDEVAKLEKKRTALQPEWEKARKDFDLTLKEWQTLHEQKETLAKDIAQIQITLDDMKGIPKPAPAASDKKGNGEKEASPPEKAPDKNGQGKVDDKKFGLPIFGNGVKVDEKELAKAKQEAKSKEQEAKEAKEKAKLLAQLLQSKKEQIEQEKKYLEIAKEKLDLATAEEQKLAKELEQKKSTGAPAKEIQILDAKLQEEKRKADEAREKIDEKRDLLSKLQAERNNLLSAQNKALQEAAAAQETAQAAQKKLEELTNPFTPRNLLQWLIDHGPKILTILLVMLVLNRLIYLIGNRLVAIITKRAQSRGKEQYREDRAQTLGGIFRSVANIAVLVGGLLMILDEVGVPIIPLLGSAAVLGLAIAFGTQHLIKDYFNGFLMLLEDQYGINDIVEVGGIAGVVEKITLRTTVLRSLDGVAHFIPHGAVTTVSNLTHTWSRAMFEIGVAYKEDADQVMKIMLDLCRQMRREAGFGPDLLDDPEMLGVDAFGDSAIVIKFFVKTRPGRQWPVKRELLRRIKRKFDELGIEIPFPHRTVYHRYEDGHADLAATHDGDKRVFTGSGEN